MSETEGTTPAPESATPAAVIEQVDGDAIRATRPEWMSPAQWAAIIEKTVDKIDELVDNARGTYAAVPCTELAWCSMSDPGEHAGYHAGDVVDLAGGADGAESLRGFWGHVFWDRGAEGPVLTIEGRPTAGAGTELVDILVKQASWLMDATSTPEARTALVKLLGEVDPA